MNRRFLGRMAAVFGAALWLGLSLPAQAADEEPDAMMTRLSKQVLEALRTDNSLKDGDLTQVIALVDRVIMPNVNFRRMTAAAVGPAGVAHLAAGAENHDLGAALRPAGGAQRDAEGEEHFVHR